LRSRNDITDKLTLSLRSLTLAHGKVYHQELQSYISQLMNPVSRVLVARNCLQGNYYGSGMRSTS